MSENNPVDHENHGHHGLAESKKIEDVLANLPLSIPIYLFTPKNPQGYTPNVAWAQKPGVQLTPDGYIKKNKRHRTNIPGVYSAGDVAGDYKQIIIAAGQGAGAAMTLFEDLMNPYWKKPNQKGEHRAPKNQNVHPQHLQPLQGLQKIHGRK